MSSSLSTKKVLPLLLVFGLGAAVYGQAISQESAVGAESEIAALKAEIETLKGMLPSQSHTMSDVDYHFTNLWFAGESGNWPLAQFYLNETRSHLNWAVRVRPVRKLSNGGQLDLRPILDGIEKSTLAELREAVEDHDGSAFEATYRQMLTQCYGCHTAAEKPYLRPHIPEEPATRIIAIKPQG